MKKHAHNIQSETFGIETGNTSWPILNALKYTTSHAATFSAYGIDITTEGADVGRGKRKGVRYIIKVL